MIVEEILISVIPYITSILELLGVLIIVLGTIRSVGRFFKTSFDLGDNKLKIDFAKALALSLEFKLAAEILKTVIIREIDEFIILAAVVALRVVITFVLHWEIKSSEEVEIIENKEE